MNTAAALKKIEKLKGDPKVLSGAIGLHYSCDRGPGLRRVVLPPEKEGDPPQFDYVDAQGRPVRDPEVLARIRSLVIPPAWRDVWICVNPDGHLQATGRDARGRKQYRYHPRWRAVSNQTKYYSLISFGEALPGLRRRVLEDLARPGLSREKVLATAVRLLETTLIRVGNVEYEKANNSIGLTTMKDDHVEINGTRLHFRFRGKSGVWHEIEVADRRLAAIVRRCRDLPGYDLFQYVNGDGEPKAIESGDVNEYLRDAMGQDFTAKDFRTWKGTVTAARMLNAAGPSTSATAARRTVAQTVKEVAALLGNRPATCRNFYIHPIIPQAYESGELFGHFEKQREPSDDPADLSLDERATLSVLRADLRRAEPLERLAETA